jgi:glycosyltransferase involved in cell wall biosynthesis
VAAALAARGIEVHVWCPSGAPPPTTEGVEVHQCLGAFTPRDLEAAGKLLDDFPGPRQILVQWVPHGYGYRSLNVEFCLWLRRRATRSGDHLDLMVHEPYLEFRWNSPSQSAAALIHRFMTVILLTSARQVWISIPSWEKRLRPYALRRNAHFDWLPVPSNIPVSEDNEAVDVVRRKFVSGDGILIGHFGTYGSLIAEPLKAILSALADQGAEAAILLMGQGSKEFLRRLQQEEPRLAASIYACGALPNKELSHHLSACDLLIQPYPDGVSTRRGSFMAGISHGRALVTTIGVLSEPLWTQTDAIAAVPVGDVSGFVNWIRRLSSDADLRGRLGRSARQLYLDRFEVTHVADALVKARLASDPS